MPGQKELIKAEDKLTFGKKLHKSGIGAKTWSLTQSDKTKIKKMRSNEKVISYLNQKYLLAYILSVLEVACRLYLPELSLGTSKNQYVPG